MICSEQGRNKVPAINNTERRGARTALPQPRLCERRRAHGRFQPFLCHCFGMPRPCPAVAPARPWPGRFCRRPAVAPLSWAALGDPAVVRTWLPSGPQLTLPLPILLRRAGARHARTPCGFCTCAHHPTCGAAPYAPSTHQTLERARHFATRPRHTTQFQGRADTAAALRYARRRPTHCGPRLPKLLFYVAQAPETQSATGSKTGASAQTPAARPQPAARPVSHARAPSCNEPP